MSRDCGPAEIAAPFGPSTLLRFAGNRLPIGGPRSLAPRLRNAQSKLRIVRRGFCICSLAPLLLVLAQFAFTTNIRKLCSTFALMVGQTAAFKIAGVIDYGRRFSAGSRSTRSRRNPLDALAQELEDRRGLSGN